MLFRSYYTGLDPRTMKPVFVPTDAHHKAMQRALMQWKRPEKRPLVLEALREAHREDLIGYGKECLLRPVRPAAGGGGAPARKGGGKPRKPEEQRYKQKGKRVEHNDPQPRRKAGWAKPKPKKNTKPGRGRK